MINYYFVIYLGHRNIALFFHIGRLWGFRQRFQHFFWTHMNIQFKLKILWLCKYICLYFNVFNDNSEYLKGRGRSTKMTLKVWLNSVFTYNLNFVAYLGYRNTTCFHIGRLWGFKRRCQAPFMLWVTMWILNLNLYKWSLLKYLLILFHFKNLISRSGKVAVYWWRFRNCTMRVYYHEDEFRW